MGRFKELDIEHQEMTGQFQTWKQYDDLDFEQVMQEMYERNVLQGAAELCRRGDYGYSKFLDELHKALNEARGNSES